MHTIRLSLLVAVACFGWALGVTASPAEPQSALARMPVKEITIFKDGHAFVLHEGVMPTNAAGDVVMDYLPAPVIGTFWPYSASEDVSLTGVKASQRKVLVQRTALSTRELLDANPGAQVIITEVGGAKYPATILGVPKRSAEELDATEPPGREQRLPHAGAIILLKTDEGTKVVAIDRIQDVTFKSPPAGGKDLSMQTATEEFRNLLTLHLNWGTHKPAKTVPVGMVYLQRGIRWIPSYKISIDGKGTALVKLQATLLNELTNLDDVTANLVVGVPSFAFKETVDPMSLQQAVAQLSSYFRPDSQTAYAFSNAIMTQSFRQTEVPTPAVRNGSTIDLGPDVTGTGQQEDLFVYTLKHISLKQGERMVVPIAEFTVKYRDIYTVDLPFAPPAEVYRNIGTERQAELARLFNTPKAKHVLRLTNQGAYPFTTAPALVLQGNRVLAQSMMTYTAIGATTDLEVTTAGNVLVSKKEVEAGRTPNAVAWDGNQYTRVDMSGMIHLANLKQEPVTIEVHRAILGNPLTADHNGKVEKTFLLNDENIVNSRPSWWGWYNWPYWWGHFNGMGHFTWTVQLDPGKAVDLGYTWNYYWR